MTRGVKITLALLGAFMLQQLIFNGPLAAMYVFILFGIGALLWECLQGVVRAILRLTDGNPRVEYHIYVPAPERAAHPDPTAPGWDDIETTRINGRWRKR